ncbi:MAG: hypothetical protein ACXVCR_10545 [Bdellovibrio sp.]
MNKTSGRYSISTSLDLFSQKFILRTAVDLLERNPDVKRSHQKERTFATLHLFETLGGILIEIADDDFFGIMIESTDKDFIRKLSEELKKIA